MKRSFILTGPLFILALWFLLTYFALIEPIFLPSPIATFATLFKLIRSGQIIPDLKWTMIRWLVGLVIGVAIGIPIGSLMGSYRKVYESLEVVIDFFRSIPIITLFPLTLILFGIGDESKIALSAWSAIIYVVINTMYGVRHVKESRSVMARSFGSSPFQTFIKVVLPDALPEISVGVRLSISMALVVVVAAEMIMGTNVGLGKRIFDAALVYQITEMYAVIILTGLLGYLSNKLFVAFENRVIHWANK
jgi:ABC-type nitrate/sulfonate/bicarbonate transport system permease component